jgi:hypothetical protein
MAIYSFLVQLLTRCLSESVSCAELISQETRPVYLTIWSQFWLMKMLFSGYAAALLELSEDE